MIRLLTAIVNAVNERDRFPRTEDVRCNTSFS